MGFWDSILGESKEESNAGQGNKQTPFMVSVSFTPLRLSPHKSNSVDLIVKVKNISPEPQLVSVDALLPKGVMLGFDKPGINKGAEKKVGEIKAGETTQVSIPIWANNQTSEGQHTVSVTIYSHYMGYNKVVSYVKKTASLRVA